ncbi:beta-lactamase domain protein [Haloterrigena turkmenica DSM 5511]|uniref:Beta-lactamase domain protein n=1 Tax=Haloterrigena turkmenica (strain ATCC 51198 / DSM 5511 / JCM 9101 / NCIMB 13204 / VKM B-1734 / 4k) TaxID=543526 RepID=D2RZJ1_HALTV|nr:rhodanese-like domain-containing protein [Haloterrigena turkmenica]ADB62030.1 beta-lactamase domain protein [Haloterrigena turkmenica DSM 5511]
MVTTLSADRLAELVDGDDAFALVDTRPEDSYESWHVPGAVHFPFGPEEELDDRLEAFEDAVGDVDRVITICAKGISSGNLAARLESATDAYDVATVDGGMTGWSGVYEHVEIDVGGDGSGAATDAPTIVQLQRRAKGCLGYVVGCPATGEAIVVDPTDDIDEYEVAAEEADLTIAGVVDTHVHADHVSGGRELADSLAVPYYLGARAADRGVDYEFTPLERNEVLDVGDLEIKALSAPGHTSEMITLLVDGAALLTADTLHVDSVGRTELEFSESEAGSASEAASSAERSSADSHAAMPRDDGETASHEGAEGAEMLYETLHRTLLAEPEDVVILPGHVTVTASGEFEHSRPGEPVATTVREARTGIDLLDLEEEAFVERMADVGEKPANYEAIIDLNRGREERPPEDRTELELGPNNCSA